MVNSATVRLTTRAEHGGRKYSLTKDFEARRGCAGSTVIPLWVMDTTTISWILFIGALYPLLVTGYVVRMKSRVGTELLIQESGTVGGVFEALMFPATIAVLVWALVYLTWYLVLLAFLAVSIIGVPAAFLFRPNSTFAFWNAVTPILVAIGIGITAWLWIDIKP